MSVELPHAQQHQTSCAAVHAVPVQAATSSSGAVPAACTQQLCHNKLSGEAVANSQANVGVSCPCDHLDVIPESACVVSLAN